MATIGVVGALVAADAALPRHGWGIPITAFSILIAVGLLDAVRRYRPADPRAWYLIAFGQFLSTLGIAVQNALGRPAVSFPGVSHALIMTSMAITTVGLALFVRARTRALDRYQLLDLAIFGVSAMVALKLLVLDPSMKANPPVGISPNVSSVYILLGVSWVVLIVRFATLPGRRCRSLWLLLGCVASIVIGSIVVNATADVDSGPSVNLASFWAMALFLAAARDRSMVTLTEPATGEIPSFGVWRVAGLGTALFLSPLTAAIVHARGDDNDLTPLLTMGPAAVITVLVMARLRLLFAREQAARHEVAASREVFSSLVHGISDVITVVDADARIAYVTNSAAKALGRTPAELAGVSLTDLVDVDDAAPLRELLADLGGSGATSTRTVRITVGDETRVFELEASDRMSNPNLRGLIVVLHDVTDRHQLERELRHQANHDALTGLPNRALLVQRLSHALEARGNTSVLFVDLDDFKDVNDGMGHQVGDTLLGAVAGRLLNAVRDGDLVARLGGDEFAVLVTDNADPEAPFAVARRVLEVLDSPFEIAHQRVAVRASVGVASAEGLSVDEVLRNADVAMYRAKAAGKGTIAVFEAGMDTAATERVALYTELTNAVSRGELRLLFQPVVDLDTGALRGGEALLRWQHPRLGYLPPHRFVDIAEETGLIIPVGAWVLTEACRHAAGWPHELTVAVNLSARQFESDSIESDIADALAASGIRPGRLVLEITESTLVRNVPVTAHRLAALRELGVRIAVDDFGTGSGSLSSLLQLRVDALKIDRSFIANMLDQPQATALVHVLIEMGRSLDLQVIAEGVEDEVQQTLLRRQRCHQGQGFLYAPPITAEAFIEYLGTGTGTGTDVTISV